MSTRIELLKQAGFSDAEIGDWATAERQRMHEAGFGDDEIDAEFGVTRPPKDVPPAFIERMKQGNTFQRIAGTAADYAERYFGDEPLGFSTKNQEFLHRLGAVGDIVIPAAKPLDAVLRAVPAGIAAVGAGVGQAVEEAQNAALGPGPEAEGKAARDFAQLAQIAAILSGGNARTRTAPGSTPVRVPAPDIAGEPAIVLPRAEDFRNAAATISGTPASFPVEQKLLRLWTEHGISPAEAAADAMRDRAIAEDLKSGSAKLPEAYAGAGRTPAAAGAAQDAPAPPVTPAAADRTGASRENPTDTMAAEDRAGAEPDAPERAAMTALSKDVAMYAPPRIPQRPFIFDYRSRVPQTDPTGRLLVDMEGRPLHANFVAGRRFAGQPDQPLTPADIDAALMQLDIRKVPIPRIPNQDDSVVGMFSGSEVGHRPVGDLYVKAILGPQDQDFVTAHEFGHGIDYFANEVSATLTTPEIDELRRVYATLRGGPGRKTLHPQPETYGYSGDHVNRELVAEGLRAYLTNPNYFKAAAPRSAAKLREAVNTNKYLKRVIQLNSLGAAGIVGAGAAGTHTAGTRDEDDQ
jgi:hypothetical protein